MKKRKLMLLQLSLLDIPEYAWMGLYKQDSEYALGPKYAKFWIWQSSEYGWVLNMRALHSVLNMPEYALTELWIYLGF